MNEGRLDIEGGQIGRAISVPQLEHRFTASIDSAQLSRLEARASDDALAYAILGLAERVNLFYMREPAPSSGRPELHIDGDIPSSLFETEDLLHHVYFVDRRSGRVNMPHGAAYIRIPFSSDPHFELQDRGPKQFFKSWAYWNLPLFYDSRRQRFFDRQLARREIVHLHRKLSRGQCTMEPDHNLLRNRIDTGGKPVAVIAMHWFETGGAESCAVEALEKAKASGFYTICVSDRRGKETYEARVRESADHVFCIARSLPPELWRKFYINLFHSFDVKLLHIHHSVIAYACLPVIKAFFPDTFVVSTTHIVEYMDGGYCRIAGVFDEFIDIQHVISQELRDYFVDKFLVPQNKLRLAYLIEDDGEAAGEPVAHNHADVSAHCKILFVGRMVQQKRPYLLVELARRLKKKGLNFSVTMVGHGPQQELVEKYARRLKVDKHISFRGGLSHDAVKQEMERHHVLVLPSQNEGLALVCYEAGQRGMAIVSTDVGSQAEVVSDRMLVPRHTRACVASMEKCVASLIEDRGVYENVLDEQRAKLQKIKSAQQYKSFLNTIYSGEVPSA